MQEVQPLLPNERSKLNVAIIVADAYELPQLAAIHLKQVVHHGWTFDHYQLPHQEIVILHCGIGIARAAAGTQALIDYMQPKIIYNYGAVGGSAATTIYQLVIPQRIYYHDVITPWYPRGQVPHAPAFYVNGWHETDRPALHLATGMTFLEQQAQVAAIQADLPVAIFDMEGAAIMQIGAWNKTKIVIVKCVSDLIGATATDQTKINQRIKKAGAKARAKVFDLITTAPV